MPDVPEIEEGEITAVRLYGELVEVRTNVGNLKDAVDKLETRTEKLMSRSNWLAGGAAVAGAFIGSNLTRFFPAA